MVNKIIAITGGSLIALYTGLSFVTVALAEKQSLTTNQSRIIISQIKPKGLSEMKDVGCISSVANRMNTGKWNDAWCERNYNHLELD